LASVFALWLHGCFFSWLLACAVPAAQGPEVGVGQAGTGGAVGAVGAAADGGGVVASAGAGAFAPAAGGGGAAAQVPPLTGFDGLPLLSQTGLYADIGTDALANAVMAYRPLAELWADDATKQRWVWLPPGTQIDSSDMDLWRYPVGTKLWKEFAIAGVRIETRLLEKLDGGDWRMVAYAWNAEQTEAYAAPLGIVNAAGTAHDIPDAEACKQCHEGLADRVLGFSALQLSHADAGMTLDRLVAEGRLTVSPNVPIALPGDSVEQAALGYLHANCGHCHRPDRKRAEREISVYFWQQVASLASTESTVTYSSLVQNKGSALWLDAVLARMQTRGNAQQMPPLASKQVDMQGVAAVSAWLQRLRPLFPVQAAAPPVSPDARCAGVEDVFAVFERAACRTAFCHGAGTGELDFTTPEQLHASMVGVPASGEGCKELTTMPRVLPGDPERSLLMIKLLPGPPCGKIMPPAAVQALTEQDLALVRDWIARCTP
jgi:hypothetical protein